MFKNSELYRKMSKTLLLLIILVIQTNVYAQQKDTIVKTQELMEMRVDKHFDSKYRHRLRQMRRTYPMALKAKEMIMEYEEDLAEIEKKRKKKKYGKAAHASLKEEFTFNIKDLYVSEGDLLLRLIHRETGMTVSEIIEKYRGKTQNNIYEGMAMLWGHDLDIEYDPDGEDWITELIIKDIQDGHIPFDKEMVKLSKVDYKESMKEYRQNKRANAKNRRKLKREKRRQKRKGDSN